MFQMLMDKAKCIEALEQRKVPKLLVHTVCSRVAALQEKIAAATKAAASSNGGFAADPATITAAATAELGEGGWSYADIIKEYLSTLQVLAINSAMYFADGLAEQLWDALMVNPPTWDHLDAALVRLGKWQLVRPCVGSDLGRVACAHLHMQCATECLLQEAY